MRPPLTFFVAGLPKAQPRAKARAFGKFAQVYNPKTADDWKMIVRSEARRAWEASGNPAPWAGPLCVDLTFYFPRPKGHFKSNGFLKPNAPKWHTTKPDVDNSFKAPTDSMTNLGIWQDDKQICDTHIRKFYTNDGGAAGCEITIREAV